ncbi:hypothetical protein CC80DRAFT_548250 [Byssothecium circinans]|uniref:Uncharacterized protein n=1 Tax=Byssothecium circinans TaxID=147558 RepID=A0A6A5TWP5_9PLEO|nr:hypothetical protein CC80DRAFT_548250 [Byssothecium circinans]
MPSRRSGDAILIEEGVGRAREVVDTYVEYKKLFDTYFEASLINSFWSFERAYILDTDSERGSCHLDYRGPIENRVCLDERHGRTYWVYSIDRSQENDSMHRKQAYVHGPRGYQDFRDINHLDLTLNDVVRSSIYVDETGIKDDIVFGKPDDIQRRLTSTLTSRWNSTMNPGRLACPCA